MLSEDVFSECQEDNIISFFERCQNKSKSKSKETEDAQEGKTGKLKRGERRIQLIGRVKMVNAEKRFGFIATSTDEQYSGEENKDKDVYFHFDKVR